MVISGLCSFIYFLKKSQQSAENKGNDCYESKFYLFLSACSMISALQVLRIAYTRIDQTQYEHQNNTDQKQSLFEKHKKCKLVSPERTATEVRETQNSDGTSSTEVTEICIPAKYEYVTERKVVSIVNPGETAQLALEGDRKIYVASFSNEIGILNETSEALPPSNVLKSLVVVKEGSPSSDYYAATPINNIHIVKDPLDNARHQ
jgi:hypothetical protein